MKGTEIRSEIPQGDGRSSRREQRESWSLGYKGEQGFEKGPLLWNEGSFPFRSHCFPCRLKRLLWKENSEKQKSWEAASIHKGKPRYWFSLCPQGELLRHNLETRGCSLNLGGTPPYISTWMYQCPPPRTFRRTGVGWHYFAHWGLACLLLLFSVTYIWLFWGQQEQSHITFILFLRIPSIAPGIFLAIVFLDNASFASQSHNFIHLKVPFGLWSESIWASIWRDLGSGSGFPGKESSCQFRRLGFDPKVGDQRKWPPTPVFLCGESMGLQKSWTWLSD